MSYRVPGGRRRTASDGDIIDREDDEVNLGHPGGGRPTSVNKPSKSNPVPGVVDPESSRRSNPALDSEFGGGDRKFKGFKKQRMKSFSTFMQKAMKSLSFTSSPRRHSSMKEKFHKMENDEDAAYREGNRTEKNIDDQRGFSINKKNTATNRPAVQKKNVMNNIYGNNRIPGIEGLRNHGNTCFMNAVLQCLSHTDILAEYFVTDQYKADISRGDKSNSKRFGTKGEITEHLAVLLKSLWSCKYTPEISSEFKSIVGKYGSQYRGYGQHDAQEFFLWLLDKVHEDLNTAAKKKYRANKSSLGRADDLVAAEALANHMRNNNSFVYDLFQALYRSSLMCPRCELQSNTFDPFLCVSLPIPQKTYRPVFVTVVYLDAQPKQVRIGLMMDQLEKVKDLRKKLVDDTGIPGKQLMLTEICYDGFHRTFHDNQPLSDIQETDNVFAIEMPVSYIDTLPPNQYPERDYIVIVLLNKVGVGPQGKKFGYPVVMQIPRDSTFIEVQDQIFRHMKDLVKPVVFQQKIGVLIKLKAIDDISGKFYLPPDVDHPLYTEPVDRALSFCTSDGVPVHVKLVAEWDAQTKQSVLGETNDFIEEHASVRQAKQAQLSPVLSSLDECFELYTKEEKLGAEDSWMCSNCKRRQQGTIKRLNLWSLPDILVIHLKRFKQIGARRTKLNNLISFPVNGLEMRKHIVQRSSDSQLWNMYLSFSPWRRQRLSQAIDDDYIYDLYAVCNHYGNMLGGHYTAFCKNPVDDLWYSFDDTKVTSLPVDQIITRSAYMLFYQRRSLTGLRSSSGSSASSEEGHWLTRMVPFSYTPTSKQLSKSEETLLEETPKGTKSDSTWTEEAPPVKQTLRTITSYGTLSHGMKTPSGSRTSPVKSHSFAHRIRHHRKSLDPPVSPTAERSSSYSGKTSSSSTGWNSPQSQSYGQNTHSKPSSYKQMPVQTKKMESGPVMKMPPSPKVATNSAKVSPKSPKKKTEDHFKKEKDSKTASSSILYQPNQVNLPPPSKTDQAVSLTDTNQGVRPKTVNKSSTLKTPVSSKAKNDSTESKAREKSATLPAKTVRQPSVAIVRRVPPSTPTAGRTGAARGRTFSSSSKTSTPSGEVSSPSVSNKSASESGEQNKNDNAHPYLAETCV